MATVNFKLKPITTPNFVIVEGGDAHPVSVSVKDLPARTLSDLCDEFREALFLKAGKKDPQYVIS